MRRRRIRAVLYQYLFANETQLSALEFQTVLPALDGSSGSAGGEELSVYIYQLSPVSTKYRLLYFPVLVMNFPRPPPKQFCTPSIILDHFLRQIESHHVHTPSRTPLPLHYNSKTGSLIEYPWYAGVSIAMFDELLTPAHRMSFSGPAALTPKRVSPPASWKLIEEHTNSGLPAACVRCWTERNIPKQKSAL